MASQPCPSCGTDLPSDPRFVTWCHNCGWNVTSPEHQAGRTGPLGRISSVTGRLLDEALFARLAEGDALRSRLTLAKAAAYAVAICVHTFVLALVALGSWLVVADHAVMLKFLGLVPLGLAFLMRPRLGRRPTEGVVRRDEAPVLHGLVDEVAQKLGAKAPHTITVTVEYNASLSVVGVRRERALSLGLPLLTALTPDERVALLGHEVAHARNGDSSRSLIARRRARRGDRRHERGDRIAREGAARGTAATAVHRAAVAAQTTTGDVFDVMRIAFEEIPERERERRRRIARLESARLDATHPPTGRRIELLERRPPRTAAVTLDPARHAAIERELAAVRPHLSRRLVDDYRASIEY